MTSEDTEDLQLDIDNNNIKLPSGLRVFEADPATLALRKRDFVATELPVKVPVRGTIASGFEVESIIPNPRFVTVLVDAAAASIDSVLTEPVDLNAIQEESIQQKNLQKRGGKFRLPENSSPEISVTINVRRAQ